MQMENTASHANGLFLCMIKKFLVETVPDHTAFTVMGDSPWKKESFRVDVETLSEGLKCLRVFCKPDRNDIWRFSLEPEEENQEQEKEKEEKKDPLEEWIETNRELIIKLQMDAEDEKRNYFLIPADAFPGEEIKSGVVDWLLNCGDYSFVGEDEDTGNVTVLLGE